MRSLALKTDGTSWAGSNNDDRPLGDGTIEGPGDAGAGTN